VAVGWWWWLELAVVRWSMVVGVGGQQLAGGWDPFWQLVAGEVLWWVVAGGL
jgi:hypothetical protein